jgi:hypothetical protein
MEALYLYLFKSSSLLAIVFYCIYHFCCKENFLQIIDGFFVRLVTAAILLFSGLYQN